MAIAIRYFIPGDGDEQSHPNFYQITGAASTEEIPLKLIVKMFPVPGEYSFRFKTQLDDGIVWMDITDMDSYVPLFCGQVFMKVARIRFDPRVQAMITPQPTTSNPQMKPQQTVSKPTSSLSMSSHKSSPELRRPTQSYENNNMSKQQPSPPPPPQQQASTRPSPPAPLSKNGSVDLLGGFDESPKLKPVSGNGQNLGAVDDLIGLAMPPQQQQQQQQQGGGMNMDPFAAVNFGGQNSNNVQQSAQGNMGAFDAFPAQNQGNLQQNKNKQSNYQQFNGFSGL